MARTARLHIHKTRLGHLIVWRGNLQSVLPMHGKNKELGTGLVNAIRKQLDLKDPA